ncbi:nucleotidyltransferase-like protein [Paenibacillus radicis (ex Gao et al. 2016)]|uniref:Nucleotidyltransferase-like domain-containing protein n=1 Tax=Paenibacillus radicis (ex Gao et al. 2016) TaxID=1737354 RepID=A0A917HKK5_9BACL|nr:nucleotidyltransferase-like protein [Paenibacillus radicis (ex Gao et al. 2016)]GGG81202.1 hypothetical protein GCM10010918_43010 [Paenibacillus radicis (ex Gao et al. 2016)]
MKHIIKHFTQTFRSQPDVISLAAIENPYPYNPFIEGLDLLLLVIRERNGAAGTEHMRFDGERILIRTIDSDSMQQWISSGEQRNLIEWIVRGEIVLDREGYLMNIRERLMLFPDTMKEQKLLIEFTGFLRTYLQAKHELENNNILDAYSHVLSALHHWAHIVLIEEGQHPELTVWRQMRLVHPGVYKLYEELTVSHETIQQRVELVMLACEFTVMNKMKACCTLLFRLMGDREEPWSILELQLHPSIEALHVDLSLLVQKLVKRSLIREVAVMPDNGDTEALELRYMM